MPVIDHPDLVMALLAEIASWGSKTILKQGDSNGEVWLSLRHDDVYVVDDIVCVYNHSNDILYEFALGSPTLLQDLRAKLCL